MTNAGEKIINTDILHKCILKVGSMRRGWCYYGKFSMKFFFWIQTNLLSISLFLGLQAPKIRIVWIFSILFAIFPKNQHLVDPTFKDYRNMVWDHLFMEAGDCQSLGPFHLRSLGGTIPLSEFQVEWPLSINVMWATSAKSDIKDMWYSKVQKMLKFQWFPSLFMCRIATLNFSMGFNIISPYMNCVTHK